MLTGNYTLFQFHILVNTVFQQIYPRRSSKPATPEQKRREKRFIKNILVFFDFLRRVKGRNDTFLEDIFLDNGTFLDEEIVLEWFTEKKYLPNDT